MSPQHRGRGLSDGHTDIHTHTHEKKKKGKKKKKEEEESKKQHNYRHFEKKKAKSSTTTDTTAEAHIGARQLALEFGKRAAQHLLHLLAIRIGAAREEGHSRDIAHRFAATFSKSQNRFRIMHSPPLRCIIKRKTTAPGAPKKRKRDDVVRRRLQLQPPENDDVMSELEI
jgi:hypothetical protein